MLSRDQIENLDSEDVLTRHHGNHNNSVDQRFNELNRQIGDLTSIVLTLTNQIASINGEGNRPNIATTSANSRSDITPNWSSSLKEYSIFYPSLCGWYSMISNDLSN